MGEVKFGGEGAPSTEKITFGLFHFNPHKGSCLSTKPGPDHGPDHELDHELDHGPDNGPDHGSDHRR